MKKTGTKVAVGLSGGVDSSAAAALLKMEGYDVVGIFMEIFDGSIAHSPTDKHGCYGPDEKEDVRKAASVCRRLNIPFYTVDLREEYRVYVLEDFRQNYLAGKTPNPCVVCNQRIKFGFLLKKTREAGIEFDYFATGHYARILKRNGRYLLKKAADTTKDQTYFLYGLSQQQLSQTLFPVGSLSKKKVRQIAHSCKLQTANEPESQDFIAGRNHRSLFSKKDIKKGHIVDESGNILGTHKGIIHYTVGQRRGLGIASTQPLYVTKIDAPNNRIVVGEKKKLLSNGLIARDLNFIAFERLIRPIIVKAKIRLNTKEAAATVFPHGNKKARVLFHEPQEAVCPGQSVVFYSGDLVIGGGIIERAL
ncbi:MAG: tRNA 2-thiouridine(34) synthase MnmA [Deltaproteobacteria bacterium]|nr:tRNA 2-thiouridine(34) synthase MnmA [Deltaproteobacteria bacterium]